jgi:large subunit ribosomal protein L10
MSKKVKNLIEKDLGDRFKDIDGVAVINPRGLAATKTNVLRRKLREKGLRMTVVKNTLARRAVGEGKLKGFDKLLDGPSAVIYGHSVAIAVVARLLMEEKKLDEKLDIRGMFFDGEVYIGEDGIKTVSKLPTREEAIGQLVGLILSPGANLGGALKGPAGVIGGIIKAVEEKAKASEAAAPAAA